MKIIIIGDKKDILINLIIKAVVFCVLFYCFYKLFSFIDGEYFYKVINHSNAKYVTAA